MEEIKINLENLSESEREQLMNLVKKANKSENKAWTPTINKPYYFTSGYGTIFVQAYGNDVVDNERFEIGNCFPSEKEAMEAVTHQKMLTKWKRLSIEAGEEENDWNGTSKHWYVYYSCDDNRLGYDLVFLLRDANIFFPTKEACMNAVQELGAENVKKYILNIKE